MAKLISKVINIFYLGRLGMAPLTISVPILGAIAGSSFAFPSSELLFVGIVGLCAHLFGFIVNDCIDYSIDKAVPYRKNSPLFTGKVTVSEALMFAVVQALLATVIYYFVLSGSFPGFILLFSSIVFSIIYNLWSKKGKMPRFFVELSLALSIGLLFIAGALIKPTIISVGVATFAVSLSLVLLLVNSIANGLKDLETDANMGATSFAISMGCKATNGQIFISSEMRKYSTVLQGLTWLSLIIVGQHFPVPIFLLVVICILSLYSGLHLRYLLSVRTFKSLYQSFPFLYGYFSYMALCSFLLPKMPVLFQGISGLGIFVILTLPISISIRMWRRRYRLIG